MNPIFPPGDDSRASRPLAIRFPAELIRRIDQVARETHNTRSAIVLHAVRWALDEYQRQRDAEDARQKRGSAENV